MGYLALYRKFRPIRFDQLIGQESVVKALINQIATDRIGHAYLFCGARGTGKTTAAKIFARAINCESKTGEPCGKCEACKALADSSNLDIVEMDAASNNKVENVREIREKVQYPPVSGRFKVYIIDEVHMLTTEAFNALLKTLEEPPKHAVFILATTEPHKLPATILSRCMRFDFKLISRARIAKLVADIFTEEGKDFDEEAVLEIARAGEGSVRDALSVADICLSYSDQKLTYKDVIEVLGSTDREKLLQLIEQIFKAQTGECFKIVDELIGLGKGAAMLTRDLLNCFRELMITKTCLNTKELLALPDDEINRLSEIAKLIDNHGILRIVEIFSAIENDLKYSTHPRIIFETAIVKATMPRTDYNLDALMSRIAVLEHKIENGDFSLASNIKIQTAKQTKEEVKLSEKIEVSTKQISKTFDEESKKIVETKKTEIDDKETKKVEMSADRTINDSFDDFFKSPIPTPPSEESDSIIAIEEFENENQQQNDNNNVSFQNQENKVEQDNFDSLDKSVNKSIKTTVPDRRLWGVVLRKLRDNKQSILWAVCQELDTKIEGGTFYIIATKDNEFGALTKKNNYDILKEVLSNFCDYQLEIVKEAPKVDSFEQDIEKIKKDFNVKICN